MYPPELARVLGKAERLNWEGGPDPDREALRDLDVDALKGLNLQLIVLIEAREWSDPLNRLYHALRAELQARQR